MNSHTGHTYTDGHNGINHVDFLFPQCLSVLCCGKEKQALIGFLGPCRISCAIEAPWKLPANGFVPVRLLPHYLPTKIPYFMYPPLPSFMWSEAGYAETQQDHCSTSNTGTAIHPKCSRSELHARAIHTH